MVSVSCILTLPCRFPFSVCIDYKPKVIDQLINTLAEQFNVHYNTELTLVTIKNYTREALEKYMPVSGILLEQHTRANYQVVVDESVTETNQEPY